MCVESMDTNTKLTKTCFVRRSMKPGSKLRWKLLRVSTQQLQEEEEDKALKLCRPAAIRTTIRKDLRREQKRAQLAKLAEVFGVMNKKQKRNAMFEESPAAACSHSQPAGAMAPRNTTQYLMGKVYEDMNTNDNQTVPVLHETNGDLYGECLSPMSVYAALDNGYVSCLAFQERDFDEAFDQC